MPYLASKLTMDEKVVYGLLALLAKTTLIDKGKTLPPKVVNHTFFTQSRHPSKESDTRRSLHLPNALPKRQGRLTRL
jgi:hypothetical protein